MVFCFCFVLGGKRERGEEKKERGGEGEGKEKGSEGEKYHVSNAWIFFEAKK